jgi:hypothetical protein
MTARSSLIAEEIGSGIADSQLDLGDQRPVERASVAFTDTIGVAPDNHVAPSLPP